MPQFENEWPELIDRILAIWPETDREELHDLDGSRAAFVDYLANKHELTAAEANDGIDMWLLSVSSLSEMRFAAE